MLIRLEDDVLFLNIDAKDKSFIAIDEIMGIKEIPDILFVEKTNRKDMSFVTKLEHLFKTTIIEMEDTNENKIKRTTNQNFSIKPKIDPFLPAKIVSKSSGATPKQPAPNLYNRWGSNGIVFSNKGTGTMYRKSSV
jgi:hypothetical protein